ncbi:Gfo/Idh/MocA family protein [Plantactinospora endophytica]|uniref:Oxidoreductase n=1 Tax=Plantactinospora endophytica TaxID=673535 RepID=A0ABQ4EBL1_9ACTN|nr:Gfo/Idh/MocA family oxidoreductase [Plantactinospora endophytica]GIG92123.1 oxidoreductase [Plantactinospora endophytica]
MAATGSPLRFGIMGCADIALRRMLPALAAEESAVVTAIASRDPGKAEAVTKRFGGEPVHGYDALLDRDDVDAVYLPLPAVLHAEWIARALRAGKHVLAEKPLTTDLDQARELFALARRQGLVLYENFMFLRHSQHAAVARMVADGAIGELRGFAATFTIPPKPAGDIRYQPEVGGGALDDIGVYPVRAALHHLPGELSVTGAVLRVDPVGGAVLSGSVLLHTAEGVPAQLRFGMEHAYQSSYELVGSTGRLLLDRAFTPPPSLAPVVRIDRQDHREEITLPADDQFRNVVVLFTGAVATGDLLPEISAGSLRQAETVARIKEYAVRRPAVAVGKGVNE